MQKQKRTPSEDEVRLSPSVDRDTWKRLKRLADDQNRSLNDLLYEWITEKLRELEGPKGCAA
jgi:hypothetical protein